MLSEPQVENRAEQPYAAIRSQIPMTELPRVIPEGIDGVAGWLGQKGIAMAGAPFIKYNIINMPGMLDVEVGWPIASAVKGEGQISGSSFPAGQYVVALFTGDYPGLMGATGEFLTWVEKQGIQLDTFDSDKGDGFVARYESYLTSPDEVSDPSQHETLIVMKTADQ